jgi:hypothetical protein
VAKGLKMVEIEIRENTSIGEVYEIRSKIYKARALTPYVWRDKERGIGIWNTRKKSPTPSLLNLAGIGL